MQLAAVLVATGAAAFRFLVLRRAGHAGPDQRARAARLGLVAAVVALAALLVRLPLQALEIRDPLAPLLPQARALVLHTWWGGVFLAQLGVAAVAVACYARAKGGGQASWALAATSSVALGAALSLSGHAIATEQMTWLAVAADMLHVLGAALWLGAMAALAGALLERDGPADRAGALVKAFSPLALLAAGVVLLTGVISAKFRLGAWSAAWTSPYGRRLLLKLVAVGLMAACGAYNWRTAGPRLIGEGDAGPIRRSIRLELALGAVVLFATAVLVASPLPGEP